MLICMDKFEFMQKNNLINVVQFLRYNRLRKYKFWRQRANSVAPTVSQPSLSQPAEMYNQSLKKPFSTLLH
jgi:hypothetical protein